MGAIVGGLYASGMTAVEIDATMRSLDWQEAFRDAPPRQDLAFRRNQDDRNFLVAAAAGAAASEDPLPKGSFRGKKLQETLRRLTLPLQQQHGFRFAAHPISRGGHRFGDRRCVVMDKGDLAIAMRASMSAPGVFAPVELNGRLLVDGGLAENLPVNVARAMHADILIVSDVSFPLQPRAALDSALSISNQMLAILVRKDSDRQRASLSPQDILIEPNLGSAPATDFASRAPSSPAARRGAGGHRPTLGVRRRRQCVSRITWRAAPRASRACRPSSSCAWTSNPSAMKKLSWLRCSRWWESRLTSIKWGKRITDLYGLGNFETLDYTLVEQGRVPTSNPASKCGRGANPGGPIICGSA